MMKRWERAKNSYAQGKSFNYYTANLKISKEKRKQKTENREQLIVNSEEIEVSEGSVMRSSLDY
jgi:hypothetical protein